MPTAPLTRRRFLARAGLAAAAPAVVPARVLGRDGSTAPGDRIVLGAIGIGGRGRYVLGAMLQEPDVQCVAVCDVQADRLARAREQVDTHYGNRDCRATRDLHELLARPDIDAVLVATGDRWHGMATMLAARAGKDVSSEKPCSMTLAEAGEIDETVRRYARVYQAGTQRRSIRNFQLAIRLARSGRLGRLRALHASVYRPRAGNAWLPAQPEPPPEEVDWDRWLGPSPWRPFNRAYVNGAWRGQDDFGAGYDLLDWGAHTVDLCQAAAGADGTAPVEYIPGPASITLRYSDGLELVMDYLDEPFGDRGPHFRTRLGTCPVRFEGDEGWVETGDSGDLVAHPASVAREVQDLRRGAVGTDAGTHVRNFFDCVRSRGLANANERVMRSSHVACHAAAIAWRLGRPLRFDPATETFPGDAEANRLRARARRSPWRA